MKPAKQMKQPMYYQMQQQQQQQPGFGANVMQGLGLGIGFAAADILMPDIELF